MGILVPPTMGMKGNDVGLGYVNVGSIPTISTKHDISCRLCHTVNRGFASLWTMDVQLTVNQPPSGWVSSILTCGTNHHRRVVVALPYIMLMDLSPSGRLEVHQRLGVRGLST